MATLHERLIGAGLPSEGQPAERKIAIHAFMGAIRENIAGELTNAEFVAMFNLDAAQTTQAGTLKDLISAAPDDIKLLRVFKDWLYLGETYDRHQDARYLTQSNLVTRLQTEVVSQGGTLP